MALSRETMAAIFSELPEDQMMQAMKAVGVKCDYGSGRYDEGETDTGLEPWSAKEVSVESVQKPQLFERGQLFKTEQRQHGADPSQYMGPESADYQDLAQWMPKQHGMGP